jgi:phytoene dehydrogenase-like protein
MPLALFRNAGPMTPVRVAGVTIRQTDRVKAAIIEWDRVAGIEFDDGAQIRTPIIVSALPARETFLDFVGRARLDIEFTRALDIAAPNVASVRVNLAINGPVPDQHIAARLGRRFLFAPSPLEIERAYRFAAAGVEPEAAIGELVFPSAFDRTLAPEGCATATLTLHPVADRPLTDELWRRAILERAKAIFLRIVNDAEITAIDAEDSEPAAPPALVSMERRERLTGASGLEGYFFCGPEALIGGGVSLSAGRRAADKARGYFRKGGFG